MNLNHKGSTSFQWQWWIKRVLPQIIYTIVCFIPMTKQSSTFSALWQLFFTEIVNFSKESFKPLSASCQWQNNVKIITFLLFDSFFDDIVNVSKENFCNINILILFINKYLHKPIDLEHFKDCSEQPNVQII